MQQCSSLLSWRLFTAEHVSGAFPPIIRISVTAVTASGFTFVSWWHNTKVKPEAATTVIELLMMGGKTPETCWAVNKRQDNKLEHCCIWLVIYLKCYHNALQMTSPFWVSQFLKIITCWNPVVRIFTTECDANKQHFDHTVYLPRMALRKMWLLP